MRERPEPTSSPPVTPMVAPPSAPVRAGVAVPPTLRERRLPAPGGAGSWIRWAVLGLLAAAIVTGLVLAWRPGRLPWISAQLRGRWWSRWTRTAAPG
jgi:hypothetical protein